MIDNPKCVHCGVEFTRDNRRQTFCNIFCNHAYKDMRKNDLVKTTCKTCSKEYMVTKRNLSQAKGNNFCQGCKDNMVSKERSSARQCLFCGVEFRSSPTMAKFCSEACIVNSKMRSIIKFSKETEGQSLNKNRFENKMPCIDCTFGRRSIHSETGWECLANARECSPFTFKKLFKQK